jgi:hypothetical protein
VAIFVLFAGNLEVSAQDSNLEPRD